MPQLAHLYLGDLFQKTTIDTNPLASFLRNQYDAETYGRDSVVAYLQLLISNFATIKTDYDEVENLEFGAEVDFSYASYVGHRGH
jgi:hypothetical protein